MHHTSHRLGRGRRLSAWALALALVGGVTASCTPDPGAGGPSAQQQFCDFYQKVSDAPPTTDSAVLVKTDVVALAQDTTVIGTDCTAANAKVALDAAVLAEGAEVPLEQGTASTEKIAAVTGDEIGAGEPVLDNVKLQTLNAEIGVNGITVRGNVLVRLSGTTSTIGFVGTLTNLDNWSITVSSAGLTIPGITTSPVTFSGTLKVVGGVPSLSMTAAATSAKIGDIVISGATIKLDASPATGVKASVAGSLKIGPSTVTGAVDVEFDKAGALVSAKGSVDARLVGTQAGGKKVDLTGKVKFDGNATQTAISFSGSGIIGDLQINEAAGDLTLSTNKAILNGKVDVNTGNGTYARFNASIVWDGITATTLLTGEAGGEFSGTMTDGQTVSVKGNLETSIVGGQIFTKVTGEFKVGTLKATGTAIVEVNGATTVLNVDATLQNAGFSANLAGVVVITDGLAETVQLDAQVNGSVQLGDLTLTGATLSIRSSYGSPLDLSFSGGVQVGSRANLTGSVKASFGPNGGLLSLSGNLQGSLLLDSWGVLGFQGSVLASSQQVTLSGSGNIQTTNFPLGISFKGSFTSSLTQPTWSLNGSGKLQLVGLTIASARLNLSQTAGMAATRAGFYFSIIGIPTYFEGNFYMKPGGGCSRVDITGGSFLAKPILALVLPGVIGCPVNI